MMASDSSIFSLSESFDEAKASNSDLSVIKAGAESYFDKLGKNKDGILQESEISTMSGLDGDSSTFSLAETLTMLAGIALKAFTAILDGKVNAEMDLDETTENSGSNSSSGPASYSGVDSKSYVSPQQTLEEQIKALEEEKESINTQYDEKIDQAKSDKDNIVKDNTKISDELKKQYQGNVDDINAKDDEINGVKSEIESCNSEIEGYENSLASLQGELDNLDTNTDNAEVNSKNSARKSEIQKQISDTESKKSKAESKKSELESKQSEKETEKTALQDTLQQTIAKMNEQDPTLAKKLAECDKNISELQSLKANDARLSAIDTEIATKKTEKLEQSKKSGETLGKIQSDGYASELIEKAREFLGFNESDGSYKKFTGGRDEAWCADFVTYVAKQVYGDNLPAGFGSASVSGLQQWGKDNGQIVDKNDVQAGQVMIQKNNGASHTGIVTQVERDNNGNITAIHTIEGNTSDKVGERVYTPGSKGFDAITCFVSIG